jgi:hypothetical protein
MDHDEDERDHDGGGVSMCDPAAPLSTKAGDWIDRVEGRVSGGQMVEGSNPSAGSSTQFCQAKAYGPEVWAGDLSSIP